MELYSIKIKEDVYRKLQKHKKETGVAMSFTISKALDEYLKKVANK